MLKRFLKLNGTEIVGSNVVDVVDSKTIELNVAMDNEKFDKLLSETPPGSKLYLTELPYITQPFNMIVTSAGALQYYPLDIVQVDYDINFYDCEQYLAVLDETGTTVTKSGKYSYNPKNKKLELNKNFEPDFIIVPTPPSQLKTD